MNAARLRALMAMAVQWLRIFKAAVLQWLRQPDSSIAVWRLPGEVPPQPSTHRPERIGVAVALVLFAGFGGWAAWAPIESAAIAPGQIRVESYRKTVQHLEGGIVREILVSESDHVAAGQVLMRLDTMESNTTLTVLQDQDAILKAQLTRLEAERDGAGALVFPAALETRRGLEPRVAEALATQSQTFEARISSLAGEISIFREQINQLEAEIPGLQSQVLALDQQIRSLTSEIKTVSDLLGKGLATRPRLQELQRELSRIQGERGRQLSAIATAN